VKEITFKYGYIIASHGISCDLRSHNNIVDLHGRPQPCILVAAVFYVVILLYRFDMCWKYMS